MFRFVWHQVCRNTVSNRTAELRNFEKGSRLLVFEFLECREMLSVAPGDPVAVGESPTQVARPENPYARPIPAEAYGKIQPDLWAVVGKIEDDLESREFTIVPGSTAGATLDLTNIAAARVNESGAIHVYAEMGSFEAHALESVKTLGLEIVRSNERYGAIETWVPYDLVDELAGLESVELVRVPVYGVARTGQVTTAGDGIHRADDVRSRFNDAMGDIDGSGVKVGVISDGVDNRSQVQGGGTPDLPTITVDSSQSGAGDEGTAMLEIIHDLAPGADLFFSSGNGGALEMIDAIEWLVDQQVDVIVDDIGYYDEHFFSDTALAQAVEEAIGDGVVYVTAAGNDAELHYQGQWSAAPSGLHDFDATAGVDTVLNIGTVPNGGIVDVYLQWSDGWTSSSNDYDLGLWDTVAGGYVEVSTNDQSVTQRPYESIQWTNTTGSAVSVGAVIIPFDDPEPRELEVFAFGVNFELSSLADSHRTQGDSIFGHPGVEAAIAVGAINASDPGNDTVASYSSHGPSTVYTNFANQTPSERDTLDGAGIDEVETRIGELEFFPDPFTGTSAAAPHVAAMAALLLQIDSTLTPAEVHSLLTTTAVDIGPTGYDDESGHGRFDALAAAYKAYIPQAPDMTASSDTGMSSLDNITNLSTPNFERFVPADSYVRLYADGDQVGAQQLTSGNTLYLVKADDPALSNGTHQMTVRIGESAATTEENLSVVSAALPVTIDTVAPRVEDVVVGSTQSGSDPDYPVPDGSGDQIRSVSVGGPDEFSVVFDEDVSIQSADMSLIDVDTSNAFSVSDFDYDDNTFTAKITLQNALTGAFQMIVTVNGTSVGAGDVIDIAGNLLNGEWDNPTDVEQSSSDPFPSGNGTAGGTFEFYLTRMPDSNLNNLVEQGDLDDVLLNWGDPGDYADGDVNGSGTVEQGDLDQVLLAWGEDFTEWPGGAFLMAGGGGSGANRLEGLYALDAALTRLGMHDKSTERLLTERRMERAASDERAWEALIDNLASALDAQRFGSRGSG